MFNIKFLDDILEKEMAFRAVWLFVLEAMCYKANNHVLKELKRKEKIHIGNHNNSEANKPFMICNITGRDAWLENISVIYLSL